MISSIENIETVSIIGAGGAFSRGVIIPYLIPEGVKVVGYDSNKSDFPEGIIKTNNIEELLGSNAIFLSVPFGSYSELMPILQKSPNDTLIIDICSVKIRPTEIFRENGLFDDGRQALMSHPLFGPQSINESIKNGKDPLENQRIVVTEAHGRKAEELVDWWSQKLSIISDVTAEYHDKEMAKVHALTSYIGQVLLEMGQTSLDTAFKTNFFDKLVAIRDIEQLHSKELNETMQLYNPYATSIRMVFLAAAAKVAKQLGVEINFGSQSYNGDSKELLILASNSLAQAKNNIAEIGKSLDRAIEDQFSQGGLIPGINR